MKRLFAVCLWLSFFHASLISQITVGGNGSSVLSINSTTKGVLTPRMTQAERLSITNPANGLLVFQTDQVPGFYFYAGNAWKNLNASAVLIEDADQDTRVTVEKTADDNTIRMDIAGTEVLTMKKNNHAGVRMEFPSNNGNILIGDQAGRQTTGNDNVFVGDSSGYHTTSGNLNIGLGAKTLFLNTTGKTNLAIGSEALYSNQADSNVAIGHKVLRANTFGKLNTALGHQSMISNTTGSFNTAIGPALESNSTGQANTAIGSDVLPANTTGSFNTAVGYLLGQENTTGSYNTLLNHTENTFTLRYNTSGSENTVTGSDIMRDATSANQHTAIGHSSMRFFATGTNNLAIGYNALYNNDEYDNNTGIGEGILATNAGSRNTMLGKGRAGLTGISVPDVSYKTAAVIDTTGNDWNGQYATILGVNFNQFYDNPYDTPDNITILGKGYIESILHGDDHTIIGQITVNPNRNNTVNLGYFDSRVGIGTTNPHPSAIMDISSTTKGILFPRIVDKQVINLGTGGSEAINQMLIYDKTYKSMFKSLDDIWALRWTNLNSMFDNLVFQGMSNSVIPVWNGTTWQWTNTERLEDIDGNSHMRFNGSEFVIRLNGINRFRITAPGNKLYFEPLTENHCLYFGNNAGLNAGLSSYNTAIGYNALKNVTATGDYNTAFGSETLAANTTGSYNTAVGRNALKNNVTGDGNTAIGANALFDNVSGNHNTAFGFRALNDLIDGHFNTALGKNADVSPSGISYATAIGPRAYVTQSHSMVLGSVEGVNGATQTAKVGISEDNPQTYLHIKRFDANGKPLLTLQDDQLGFARLKFKTTASTNEWALNGMPASVDADARFNFRYTQDVLSLHGDGDAVLAGTLTQTSDKRLKKNIRPIGFDPSWLKKISGYHYYWKETNRSQNRQIGFIAQEVKCVFPEVVRDQDSMLAVDYFSFVPLLIEGIKYHEKESSSTDERIEQIRTRLASLFSSCSPE